MTTMTTLFIREGSEFREADDHDILTRARALIAQRYRRGAPTMADPARTAEFLRIHLGARDHEVFGLLHLNTRRRLIAVEDLFRGTLTESAVYPREVIKSVLQHGSADVILYHNHPSGSSEPRPAHRSYLAARVRRGVPPQ
jgi:DNA repair protein RadC